MWRCNRFLRAIVIGYLWWCDRLHVGHCLEAFSNLHKQCEKPIKDEAACSGAGARTTAFRSAFNPGRAARAAWASYSQRNSVSVARSRLFGNPGMVNSRRPVYGFAKYASP